MSKSLTPGSFFDGIGGYVFAGFKGGYVGTYVVLLLVLVAKHEKLVAAVAYINGVGKKLTGEGVKALRSCCGNAGKSFNGAKSLFLAQLHVCENISRQNILRVYNQHRTADKCT